MSILLVKGCLIVISINKNIIINKFKIIKIMNVILLEKENISLEAKEVT